MRQIMTGDPERAEPGEGPAAKDRPRHDRAEPSRKAATGHRLFQLLKRKRLQAVLPRAVAGASDTPPITPPTDMKPIDQREHRPSGIASVFTAPKKTHYALGG